MANWLKRLLKQLPRTTGTGGCRKSSRRPSFEALEQRLAPAFDLTIGAYGATANPAPTTGVTHDSAGNFTATAHGANIAVSDILIDLRAGKSVHISDGTGGGYQALTMLRTRPL